MAVWRNHGPRYEGGNDEWEIQSGSNKNFANGRAMTQRLSQERPYWACPNELPTWQPRRPIRQEEELRWLNITAEESMPRWRNPQQPAGVEMTERDDDDRMTRGPRAVEGATERHEQIQRDRQSYRFPNPDTDDSAGVPTYNQ